MAKLENMENKRVKFNLKKNRQRYEAVTLEPELQAELEKKAPVILGDKLPKVFIGKQNVEEQGQKNLYVVNQEPVNDEEDLHLLGYYSSHEHGDFLIAWSSISAASAA